MRGLIAVLAALECEVAGVPEWVLARAEDDGASPAVELSTALSPTRAPR